MFDYNGQSHGTSRHVPAAYLLLSPGLTPTAIQQFRSNWCAPDFAPQLLGFNRLPVIATTGDLSLVPDITLYELEKTPPGVGSAIVVSTPAPAGVYCDPRFHRLLRRILATGGTLTVGITTLAGLYRIGLGTPLRAAGDRVVVGTDGDGVADVPVFVRRAARQPRLSIVVGS